MAWFKHRLAPRQAAPTDAPTVNCMRDISVIWWPDVDNSLIEAINPSYKRWSQIQIIRNRNNRLENLLFKTWSNTKNHKNVTDMLNKNKFIYLTNFYATVSGEPIHSAEIQTKTATITVHMMKNKRWEFIDKHTFNIHTVHCPASLAVILDKTWFRNLWNNDRWIDIGVGLLTFTKITNRLAN
jgi:hypothetical protein